MRANQRKFTVLFIGGLFVLTAAIAIFYLNTRTKVPEGRILVEGNGSSVELSLSSLQLEQVQGQMRTNKGEVRDIDGQGISLKSLIRAADFAPDSYKEVHVTADDGYYAVITPEEMDLENNVYLILQEEGLRLIVFEDTGSKRNVSHVVSVTLVPYE